MNKTLSIKAFAVAFAVIALSAFAQISYAEVQNGDDDAGANAPANVVSNGGDDNQVAAAGSVTNGEDDTNAGSTPAPTPGVSNGDDDISTTPSPIPTPGVSNGDDDTSAPVVENPGTDPQTGSPSSNRRSSGRNNNRNRSSNSSVAINGNTDSVVPPCAPISQFMKAGASNDAAEVTKLQQFLQNVEKFDVSVTGVYDAQTVEAVKAFQVKYQSEIMSPWGATVPSGQVYITTLNKINSLICKTPIALTAGEVAQISAYNTVNGRVVAGITANASVASKSPSSSASIKPEASGKANTNLNVGAAIKADSQIKTFFKKIFNFIFGK